MADEKSPLNPEEQRERQLETTKGGRVEPSEPSERTKAVARHAWERSVARARRLGKAPPPLPPILREEPEPARTVQPPPTGTNVRTPTSTYATQDFPDAPGVGGSRYYAFRPDPQVAPEPEPEPPPPTAPPPEPEQRGRYYQPAEPPEPAAPEQAPPPLPGAEPERRQPAEPPPPLPAQPGAAGEPVQGDQTGGDIGSAVRELSTMVDKGVEALDEVVKLLEEIKAELPNIGGLG